ncbi:MAG: C45 family peptidase [Halobacteriales archaeon]|nr:C45 family peptidase [Halobacteriales archaeon]
MSIEQTTLTGPPRERGIAHGEQFGDEIAHNAEFYLEYFADNGVDERTARAHADSFIERVDEYHPTYGTEMRGVAEGSDVPLEEVTLINFRHTILYSAYASEDTEGAPDEATTEGCTSFALSPEVTAASHTYLGQNWDWQAPVERLVMNVSNPDGPDYLALTEAGNVGGKFGLNEHGIGFVVNGLSTPADGTHPYRKPAHVRDLEILTAERLDTAIGAVIETARPTSRNYLFGRATGELVDLETTPDAVSYLTPTDGVLTHANHFEDRDGVESIFERQIPHTVSRKLRISRLFEQAGEEITESTMKEILRDHVGEPKSICRHLSDDDSLSHTNASVIMDLDERRMLATGEPPCETRYQTFHVGAE